MTKFNTTHDTTTQQPRSGRGLLSLTEVCVWETCSQLCTWWSAECCPWGGPIRQAAHCYSCSSTWHRRWPVQPGNKMKTGKTGKEEIKLALLRWQIVYVENPRGPSENSLIRKSTVSRDKVWNICCIPVCFQQMEKPIKKTCCELNYVSPQK